MSAAAPALNNAVVVTESVPLSESVIQVVDTIIASRENERLPDLIATLGEESGANIGLALAIARCESHLTHYLDSGKVLRGRVNRYDVGVFQINEHFHAKKSAELGFDIYTPVGNIGYALWMLKTGGPQPWKASKSCWGKHLALAK